MAAQYQQLFHGGDGGSLVGKKWGWFSTIHYLAKGDILKIEAVTELGLIAALNFLAYEQDVDSIKRNNYDV